MADQIPTGAESLLWRLDYAYRNPHREHLLVEARAEIERLRARLLEFETQVAGSKLIHAPQCGCGLTMDPSLLNVTGFGDGTQAWMIGWRCVAEGNHGHEGMRNV